MSLFGSLIWKVFSDWKDRKIRTVDFVSFPPLTGMSSIFTQLFVAVENHSLLYLTNQCCHALPELHFGWQQIPSTTGEMCYFTRDKCVFVMLTWCGQYNSSAAALKPVFCEIFTAANTVTSHVLVRRSSETIIILRMRFFCDGSINRLTLSWI